MNKQQKLDFKKKLQQHCIAIIEERIASCYLAMENAQSAANNEAKSSAGDKYETSRAMSHLEKDMHAKQLFANKKELAAMLNINCNKIYECATAGSVVKCDEFSFFIAAGLGKIFMEEDIFLLSPYAPIATLLNNKKAGDVILFNKKELIIRDVY